MANNTVLNKPALWRMCMRTILLFTFFGAFASGQRPAQEDLSVLADWPYYSENPNALYLHLSDLAFEKLDNREAAVAKLKSIYEASSFFSHRAVNTAGGVNQVLGRI